MPLQLLRSSRVASNRKDHRERKQEEKSKWNCQSFASASSKPRWPMLVQHLPAKKRPNSAIHLCHLDLQFTKSAFSLAILTFSLVQIRSDGHCLYRALAHQLSLLSAAEFAQLSPIASFAPLSPYFAKFVCVADSSATPSTPSANLRQWDVDSLRHVAAAYMRAHKDNFVPFMMGASGEQMTDGLPDLFSLCVHQAAW